VHEYFGKYLYRIGKDFTAQCHHCAASIPGDISSVGGCAPSPDDWPLIPGFSLVAGNALKREIVKGDGLQV